MSCRLVARSPLEECDVTTLLWFYAESRRGFRTTCDCWTVAYAEAEQRSTP